MHAPDGFLTAATAVACSGISLATVGAALRLPSANQTSGIPDRQIPLAGMAAAFLFAAQMINFPIAAGTTGHLLGGALAAVLLGPRLGLLVATVVVAVQALVFADGGLSALGYNVLNIAVVTTLGGWAVFLLARKLLPKTSGGVSAAAGIAAGASVVLSAMAFSVEWLFGASAPIAFDTVFGAMVSVHLVLGLVEGFITAITVAAVLAARPDLVEGASHLPPDVRSTPAERSARGLVIAGLLTAMVLAMVISQFAASDPDGLERVALDKGITGSGELAGPLSALFSDYATAGIDNPALSLAVAGGTGVTLALCVTAGVLSMVRSAGRPNRRLA